VNAAAIATCANHPQREAIGVCVKCRTRVCSECSTKVEGINYCVSCLAGLAVEGGRKVSAGRRTGADHAYLGLAGYVAVLTAAMWILLEVVLPGGG
jgi:hypothetical protein